MPSPNRTRSRPSAPRVLPRLRRGTLLVALPVLLVACAGQQAYRDGQKLTAAGKVDEGIAKYKEAAKAEPEDAEYRKTCLLYTSRCV
ncbi:hypothetical protein [Burkholderia gladioli]|uniref:hypothetical protein n=1 Tax=Burkholderia gladioli TaxID=28095 RepID=UPI0013F695AA|nr:hypothetical protein [Burkholderia gladioli]NHH82694.1 hypothetical protein [Burkholderia gladioli]